MIIDGSSLLSTQYYGNLPREIMFAKTTEEKERFYHKIMKTSKGVYTNAIYGFMRTLIKIAEVKRPAYLAVAWDISRNTFRRELYADYKGNRGDTPVPLKEQFELCEELLKRMGVPVFMDEKFEADDLCGTISRLFENEVPVKILTKDNDYLQLVSENTNLWMIHGTAKKTEELYKKYSGEADPSDVPDSRMFNFTPELVVKEFGILPSSVPSLKGIAGDPSDNIKGVPGVGEASAVALIARYKTVSGLYDEINNRDEKGLKELNDYWKTGLSLKRSPLSYLIKTSEDELVGEKAARLCEKLATIRRDVDLNGLTLQDLKLNINIEETAKIFAELEFKSLSAAGFGGNEMPYKAEEVHIIKDNDALSEFSTELLKEKKAGASFVIGGNEIMAAGFAGENAGTSFIVTGEGLLEEDICGLLQALKDKGIQIAVNDIKSVLPAVPLSENDVTFDVSVAAYLLDPIASEYDYSYIGLKYCNAVLAKRSDVLSKKTAAELLKADEGRAAKLFGDEASINVKAATTLENALKDAGMLKLYREIEHPLIFTLSEMEQRGIKVNRDNLTEYGKKLGESIEVLKKEIFELAGGEFNINSPKQLGEILFEKLKLPYGKKTKTGYSTSADVLEKLRPEDPVIGKILDYRTLTKLKSTYADGLFAFIGDDGRIHSKFNQTITATGRLSSAEPNLQNIPVRYDLGRQIRRAFVPKDGYIFVNADYSQIELRLLAHMSKDEKLIGAYKNAEDIHRTTASLVFKTPLDEVTPAQRSNAKAVNFGIVYGISSFGLGQDLNISRKEAEGYIKSYFESYPGIKAYLDGLVESAKNTGFAVTEYGRRRPVPELTSSNFMERQLGERIAMNSPIQGTAADIIKIAMINVNRRLKAEGLKSELILQIHDELLIETEPSEKKRVIEILTDTMKHAADLSVELEVSGNEGDTWYDLK